MKNKIKKWIVMALLLIPSLSVADPAKLVNIAFSSADDSTRVKLFLTHGTPYTVFQLSHPDRLVIDVKNTKIATPISSNLSNPIFKSMRIGHPDASTLRLVFDLKTSVKFKANAASRFIFLDVYNEKKPIIKKSVNPVIIVIDPGHGGKDPGAIGYDGVEEKKVVLAIALRLAALVNNEPNMKAVLTRKGDYFVPLMDRLKLARRGKGDLFISIHADSNSMQSRGVSVYALSSRGATCVAAKWLANRENHSELGRVDLSELEDQSLEVRSVLIDLAQTATATDSFRLGTEMLNALDNVTRLHYSRVEQAPFLVLKSPDIPSILVETGYLSNPKEEVKLANPDYQNEIAEALLNGLKIYIKKYESSIYAANSKVKPLIS